MESQLKKLDRRRVRWNSAYATDEDMTDDEYQKGLAEIRRERSGVDEALARLDSAPSLPTDETLDKMGAAWAFDRTWGFEAKKAWLSQYVAGIYVSREGVDSVTFRLPTPDGTVHFWSEAVTDATWNVTRTATVTDGGKYLTASMVAAKMGITKGAFQARLKRGKHPYPERRTGNWYLWTREEAEALANGEAPSGE